MPTNEHDYLKELWYNRPWRYIPAVVRYMRAYSPTRLKARGGRFSYKTWLRNCLYINWQVAFKHDGPVYDRCTSCLCYKCTNKHCRKKACAMCDKLHKTYYGKGMTTVVCGRAHIVESEDNA